MRTFQQLLGILLSLFLSAPLQAQREDLTHDRDIFVSKSRLYQKWLDHSGLGKILRVKDIEVESQQVALYLSFPTENPDSVTAAWASLKRDYDAQQTGMSLE